MATFKVGQRVKLVAIDAHLGWMPRPPAMGEGGIVVPGGVSNNLTCRVLFDKARGSTTDGAFGCFAHEIAPLTDPKADEFIERIKKLKPEPVLPAPEKLPSLADVLTFYQNR